MKWQVGRKAVVMVLIASAVLVPTQPVFSAHPAAPSEMGSTSSSLQGVTRDVALQPGGLLRGQIVDAQGRPCVGVAVSIVPNGTTADRTAPVRTDREGQFQFAGLAGGVYGVQTAKGGAVVRLWAPHTAPPAAVPAVLLIDRDGLVRGNCEPCGDSCNRGCGGIILGPLEWAVIGAGVAAAIAIPLALRHNNSDAS